MIITTSVCDACGKKGDVRELSYLMDCPQIKHICGKCEKIANTLLDKYRHMAWRRARKKLLARRRIYLSAVQEKPPTEALSAALTGS